MQLNPQRMFNLPTAYAWLACAAALLLASTPSAHAWLPPLQQPADKGNINLPLPSPLPYTTYFNIYLGAVAPENHAGTTTVNIQQNGEHIHTLERTALHIKRAGHMNTISTQTQTVETLSGQPISIAFRRHMPGEAPFSLKGDFNLTTHTLTVTEHENEPTTYNVTLPSTQPVRLLWGQLNHSGLHLTYVPELNPHTWMRATPEGLVTVIHNSPTNETTRYPLNAQYNNEGELERFTFGGGPAAIHYVRTQAPKQTVQAPDLMQRVLVPLTAQHNFAQLRARLLETFNPADANVQLPHNENAPLSYPKHYLQRYLQPSALLNWKHPSVENLATKLIPFPKKQPLRSARKLTSQLNKIIKSKHYGINFAKASTVATNKQGDCSEHATLLAACARALGWPSRLVSGYARVPAHYTQAKNITGLQQTSHYAQPHIWAELYINGQWHAFDAALPHAQPKDYIALARSALNTKADTEKLTQWLWQLNEQTHIE